MQMNGNSLEALNQPRDGYSFAVTNIIFDVGEFAGNEVKLTFVGPVGPFFGVGASSSTFVEMDSIRFVTQSPSLSVKPLGSELELSWPISTRGYVLESILGLAQSNGWEQCSHLPLLMVPSYG